MPVVHPVYFAEILSGTAEALYEQDMQVVLCPTRHSHARELSLLDRLTRGQTDGAILVLPEESSTELQALASQGFRFVVVDPLTEVAEGIPVVCAAHSAGATQATRHLLDLGHRRIGVITGPAGWLATEQRLSGYHGALVGAGVLPDPALVQLGGLHASRAAGPRRSGCSASPDRPPPSSRSTTAWRSVCCRRRQRAGCACRTICPWSASTTRPRRSIAVPALTTVRQPLAELGRTAVSLLVRQLGNTRFEPLRVELATRLVPRGSTAPLG